MTEKYNIQVVFEYVAINKNSVEQIVETLADIVENEEDCVFDLTGGDDLVLVAMGIVYERYREKRTFKCIASISERELSMIATATAFCLSSRRLS